MQSLPLGSNFTPGVKLYPWGQTLPLGSNFTPGIYLYPWDLSLPLGSNFTPEVKLYPWGQTHAVKNWPLSTEGASVCAGRATREVHGERDQPPEEVPPGANFVP
jgi:hypothetical protein